MPIGVYPGHHGPKPAPVLDRLRKSARYDRNGCFRWQLAKSGQGYGWIKIRKVMYHAHRVAWEQANRRAIPDGLFVCHKCDVRDCIRPSHLFLGTCAENNQDRAAKGRNVLQDGEDNPGALLTWDSVRAIRAAYAAGGVTHKQLAAQHAVTRVTVLLVLHNKTWHDPAFTKIRGHRLRGPLDM